MTERSLCLDAKTIQQPRITQAAWYNYRFSTISEKVRNLHTQGFVVLLKQAS